MSAHTPGPWTQKGGVHVTNDYVKGPDDELIAAVYAPYPSANARLIAAAPDLLEALRDLMEIATWVGSGNQMYQIDVNEALRKANAALAKAVQS
jgi:hypothetical protein